MAKELPYFKFEASEWLEGNIQMCSYEAIVCFLNLCSGYWIKLGCISYAFALHKYCNRNASVLQELKNNGVIDIINDQIIIKFLDLQLKEVKEVSEKRRKAAEKRWNSKKYASALQVQSKSNAIREDKKREDNNTIYNREIDFLKDWKKAREKLIGKPTDINKLNISERRDFEVLRNEFSIEDFRKGMVGLFSQKGMFESSQLRPSHFLRDRNIEKYIDCKTNDIQLFKEEKQVKL